MKKMILLLTIFIALPLCSAQLIESNSYDLKILYNKLLVENEILFDETQDIDFSIDLPKDATGLSLYVDGKLKEPAAENNELKLFYSSVKKIKLSYITKEPLEKDSILINLITPLAADKLNIVLTLPEGAVLEKSLGDGMSGSVYPKPDEAITDGKSMIFEWNEQDLKKDQETAVFVKYEQKSNTGIFLWILSLSLIALIGFIVLRKQKIETIIKKEKALEIHLKEDEEQIVEILKRKEGSCEQGTLRVITGFSKATLSRLIKELEDRKIVYKEKRGKKNLVFLKKQ